MTCLKFIHLKYTIYIPFDSLLYIIIKSKYHSNVYLLRRVSNCLSIHVSVEFCILSDHQTHKLTEHYYTFIEVGEEGMISWFQGVVGFFFIFA